MFRGFMPALTLLVFGIGMGIGLAWSQGLIPLSFTPANSGSLSVEITERESLPPPPDDSQFPLHQGSRIASVGSVSDETENFEQQTEPVVESSNVIATNASSDVDRSRTISAHRQIDLSPPSVPRDDSVTDTRRNDPGSVRTRDRAPVQLDPQSGVEEVPASETSRRVRSAAHQDPNEPSDDARQTARESKSAAKSPREQLASAEEKLAGGETLAAHRELSRLYWNHKDFRPQIQEMIDSTAKAIFFQPKPHYVEPYVIQEGDRLEVIAKKYQLSWEYVAKLNRTEPRRVQVGQKLKVMKGPFGAVVDLHDFTLTVHLQGYYVKPYPIGIGKDDSSPIGKFAVVGKLENPQYTGPTGIVIESDDPKNPLGERWIDLGNSYGIHGTIDPSSIGRAASAGCIRLRDNDIIEVYNFLVKGSEVVLRK